MVTVAWQDGLRWNSINMMALCSDTAEGKSRAMEDFEPSALPVSTLICQEHEAFSIDDDDETRETTELLHLSYTEEYLEILLTKENDAETTNIRFLRCKWLRCEAIQWILKMKESFGFCPQTVYMAVSYFDRFLMRRSIDNEQSWVVQLLSVACISLAAKMEEVMPPSLIEYQTEKCYFDAITIQRMELFVLSTLEWRMSSVAPFSYLRFFTNKFFHGSNFSRDLLSKSIGFIFSVLEEINLVEFRASVIAAAAVLAALDMKLTRQAFESKLNSVTFLGFMETEKPKSDIVDSLLPQELVYSCYKLMTWESKKRSAASCTLDSSDLSESSLDDMSDCGSLVAGNSSKRKRTD
ncbi:Cyclin-D5-1 [Platanthera zijinensis]|uniref:Cyclin-D5-1 n=1 Tax=Platanthera zijinensis TaxID=2320716 RepID=A0AAP0C0A9_9ASPA